MFSKSATLCVLFLAACNRDSGVLAEDASASSVDEASWVLDCERNLLVNAPRDKHIKFGSAGKLAFNPTSGDIVSDQMARLEAAFDVIEGLKETNSELKQELAALKQDVAAMKPDLDAVKTDVSTVKTDVASMKPDLSTVKVDVAAVLDDVDVTRTNITALQDDVAKLKPEVVGVRNDVGTVTAKNAAVSADVAGLKTDKAGLRTDLDALAGTVATLTGGVKNLTAAAAEAEEAQINVTNALSNVVYGDEFHPGGFLDFTEGSASLAIQEKALVGVKVFLGTVTIVGENLKGSVISRLLKSIMVVNSLICYNNQADFAVDDTELVFESLTFAGSILMDNNNNDARQRFTAISAPMLEYVSRDLGIHTNKHLKTVSMPKLKGIGKGFGCQQNPALTSLQLPSLINVHEQFNIENAKKLTANNIQVSKKFEKCNNFYATNMGSGFQCTTENGLKALVAASNSVSSYNHATCRK